MKWSQKDIEILQDMWNNNDSTRIIGEALSKTRNSIIGKAHRLGLQSRPSPIREKTYYKKPVFEKNMKTKTDVLKFTYKVWGGKCQWIAGEPTKTDNCKCLKKTVYRKDGVKSPYCMLHTEAAWRPHVRKR